MLNLLFKPIDAAVQCWAAAGMMALTGCLTLAAETPPQAMGSVAQVQLNDQGKWQILRNGQPYSICGGGGQERMDLFAQLGGNSVRTWGINHLQETDRTGADLMERAQKLDLTVIAGIWVEHPRHGFDYDNKNRVRAQRRKVREIVREYRNRPALLIWGLGNEVEMQQDPADYPKLFAELNELARIIKEEDPYHPVMTSIVGSDPEKIRAILENYPELDILGINAYGAARKVPEKVAAAGWTGPYILSEFGPNGPWESPKTDWGVPIEPTPAEKMEMYSTSYEVNTASPQCIGTYAFRWGSKQEFTATWFGLLLPTGEKTPVIDYLSKQWTGHWPTNRSPQIEKIRSKAENQTVRSGASHTLRVYCSDEDNDNIILSGWVMEESSDTKIGGDAEEVPPRIDDCFEPNSQNSLTFTAPKKEGNYRAFIKASDEHGGACVYPFPFKVE